MSQPSKTPEQLMAELLKEWGPKKLAAVMYRALAILSISKPICEISGEKEEVCIELWQLKHRFEEMQ